MKDLIPCMRNTRKTRKFILQHVLWLLQCFIFVKQQQILLSNKGNIPALKFFFHAFLIYSLKETASHLTVNIKYSSPYGICLLF